MRSGREVTPNTLLDIVGAHRAKVVRSESANQRAAALAEIINGVYANSAVRWQQMGLEQQALAANPSALGMRWKDLFSSMYHATSDDVFEYGAIARLDQAVAEELARDLFEEHSEMTPFERREQLVAAMLEGSRNLPTDPAAREAVARTTIDAALRRAARRSAWRR
jgi:hypothetical protein